MLYGGDPHSSLLEGESFRGDTSKVPLSLAGLLTARPSRPAAVKQLPASYTTVFERPSSVTRRLMSNSERLQYLLTGVKPKLPPPLPTPRTSEREAAVAASDASASRQVIEHLIRTREALVERLQEMLPMPGSTADCEAATKSCLQSVFRLAELRHEMADTIRSLRETSAAICSEMALWRNAMRRRSASLALLPGRELTFCHGGISYLLKMSTDLACASAACTHAPCILYRVPCTMYHVPCASTALPSSP